MSYTTAVHTVDGKKVLKDGHCMIMLGGCHRHRSIKMVQKEDMVAWVLAPLRTRYAFRVDV